MSYYEIQKYKNIAYVFSDVVNISKTFFINRMKRIILSIGFFLIVLMLGCTSYLPIYENKQVDKDEFYFPLYVESEDSVFQRSLDLMRKTNAL